MNRIKKELCDSISVTQQDGDKTIAAEFSLPADFIGFQGHFEGQPILPGVGMIEAVVVVGELALGNSLKITKIERAKFFAPVSPNMTVTMNVRIETLDDGYRLKAEMESGEQKTAKISLLAVS